MSHSSELAFNPDLPEASKDPRIIPDYVRIIVISDVHGRKKELFLPASLDLDRPKRPRTTFTPFQVRVLEESFRECNFVSEDKRRDLGSFLNLSENQIKIWYQNRRSKERILQGKSKINTFN